MKVLCVAEKPSIAKSIALILASGNGMQNEQGRDKYCRNYEFQYRMPPGTTFNQTRVQGWIDVAITSVRGHVMEQEFPESYKKWHQNEPLSLFTAPIQTRITQDARNLAKNIQDLARHANVLMIWTDCDREGEHIGHEIVQICHEVNSSLQVKRARFSAIIANQIHHAMQNPVDLDMNAVEAVQSRIELDLRLGATFTRFQTLRLQSRFRDLDSRVISYGPCQFPTLGFVVEQYCKVMEFVPEPFWYIAVMHKRDNMEVDFRWSRNHLFQEQDVKTIYERCRQNPEAVVVKVECKQTRKFKPKPLTTVELQKAGGRLLRMAPKKILDIAEKLYQRGLLSYPRTETDQYDNAFDFQSYIQKQAGHPDWGSFAARLGDSTHESFEKPINGQKNDKAHPPIHPTKPAIDLIGDEKRVYEYVTRRFLASCAKHAVGLQTSVTLEIAKETFLASGIVVQQRNYLEVFTYENWGGPALPKYTEGEKFMPSKIDMKQGETSRPKLLTEADLVSLMDRNGIGTDATIAEHINKIIEREYVILLSEGQTKYLVPSTLGMGLVEGYNSIELEGEKSLCKPLLRRETEEHMKLICEGKQTKRETINASLQQYRDVYQRVQTHFDKLLSSVHRYLHGESDSTSSSDIVQAQQSQYSGSASTLQRRDEGIERHGQQQDTVQPSRATSTRRHENTSGETEVTLIEIDDDDDDLLNEGEPTASSSRNPLASRVDNVLHAPSSEERMCRCEVQAVMRTVQKDGHNKGRKFWSCVKNASDPTNCGFFEWMDSETLSTRTSDPSHSVVARPRVNNSLRTTQRAGQRTNEQSPRRCRCNLLAQQLTVSQAGPNHGRTFYKCPNTSKVAQCGYFEWEDGVDDKNSEQMKCFLCDQAGHWSRTCPTQAGNGTTPAAPRSNTNRKRTAEGSRRGKCYQCGQSGHWANECSQADRAEGGRSRNPPKRRR